MPHILQGESTLISSPTASGKTEAVFAPLYQRHVSFSRQHLSLVYVAPTKALVNDMYARLGEYFSNASEGLVQRYTGDHHDFSNSIGKFALLTTPEALDSLQLTRPESLTEIRALVCDELHLLHGTGRGQQLRSVIARIRAGLRLPQDERDKAQTIAMTATLQDRQSVCTLWLGPAAAIVEVGEPRPIHMQFLRVAPQMIPESLLEQLQLTPKDKVLVFANTRNQAHELAARLHFLLAGKGWPVYLHVGLLARSERERIEYAMKHERRGICVATSTLEVGIDIGDVDVVVLCQPPRSVSSFLQRLGRGNRRSGECIVWATVNHLEEELTYRALLELGQKGILDDVHEYHRFSVDLQQLISLAWIGVQRHDPLTTSNFLQRSGGSVEPRSLSDMIETGILRDVRGALIPNDNWMDLADRRQVHSVIVGTPGVPVIDAHSGETIGTADQNISAGLFFAGTRMRTATTQDGAGIYVESPSKQFAGTKLATLPTSYGGRKGCSRQLGWALAELKGANPRKWVREGYAVTTYGGEDFNLLLKFLLSKHVAGAKLESDSERITGLPIGTRLNPQLVRIWASEIGNSVSVPAAIARKFREATAFTKYLSQELDREEAQEAVPLPGFLRWLDECEE